MAPADLGVPGIAARAEGCKGSAVCDNKDYEYATNGGCGKQMQSATGAVSLSTARNGTEHPQAHLPPAPVCNFYIRFISGAG